MLRMRNTIEYILSWQNKSQLSFDVYVGFNATILVETKFYLKLSLTFDPVLF